MFDSTIFDLEMLYPITMRTRPPNVPMIKAAVCEPIIWPKPARMTTIIIISVIIWPRTTIGPAINPFFTESEIVTVNMGPGTNAPYNPTPNEVNANKTISIN